MDDDDMDSQRSAFEPYSLSWWMMKNLWQRGVSDDRRLRLALLDTVLLEDGHLVYWYFTSSKSGRVLKRANKRLDWEDCIKFLVLKARKTWGTKPDPSWTPGVIATGRRLREGETYTVMLTASDLKALREKHNMHLLDEIVAIQPYVAKKVFSGCGLFETEFERTERFHGAQAVLATHELARWPQEDVKWSDSFDFQGGGRGRGGGGSLANMRASDQARVAGKRRDSLAKSRVHGVLHRMLAATTKSIVEHVERESGEVILRVVAQYAFRPGSGQPTLFWLDSVETLRSSAQQVDLAKHDNGNDSDIARFNRCDRSFMQLTRELGEPVDPDNRWSTYFPPKMSDIVVGSGGGTATGVTAARGDTSTDDNNNSSVGTMVKGGGINDGSIPPIIISLKGETASTAARPTPLLFVRGNNSAPMPAADDERRNGLAGPAVNLPAENKAFVVVADDAVVEGHHHHPHILPAKCSVDDKGMKTFLGDNEGRHPKQKNNTAVAVVGVLGNRPEHFELPTESWAYRSAGWRGRYFSGGGEAPGGGGRGGGGGGGLEGEGFGGKSRGGGGGGEGVRRVQLPYCEQWPRKRSTGTTMRVDQRRPDLRRHASEASRPWTAPARVVSSAGGEAVANDDDCHAWGTTGHRNLTTWSGCCYGDYCHYSEGIGPANESSSIGENYDSLPLDEASPPFKFVPYRSILKCRAEEKALSLQPETRKNAGRGIVDRLQNTSSAGVEDYRGGGDPAHGKKNALGTVASWVAERMHLLAIILSDDGQAEYFGLNSSNRARAGAPEATKRAVEELLYEEAMSHLHPTTVCRRVTVCDGCATVYGYMDAYRRHTKRLMALSAETSRAARIEWRRQLQRRKMANYTRPHTAGTEDASPPPLLRRYSDLNLKAQSASPYKMKKKDNAILTGGIISSSSSRYRGAATAMGTRSPPGGHNGERSKAPFRVGKSGDSNSPAGVSGATMVERGCTACGSNRTTTAAVDGQNSNP